MPEPVGHGHGQDEDKRTARAMLAAALLDYDLDSTAPGPSANAQTSAILAPLRHLLIQHPPPHADRYNDDDQDDEPEPEPERPPSRTSGWFGRRASAVLSGGASDRGDRPKRLTRRSASSASASVHPQDDAPLSSPSEYSIRSPVEVDGKRSRGGALEREEGRSEGGGGAGKGAVVQDEDEERLADEWGLSAIMTKVGNRPTTPGGTLMSLPRVAPVSEADETRSAPDLDRSPQPLASTSTADPALDPDSERRPRIRILERKPGHPVRPHTMLEPTGRLDFPDFSFDAPSAFSGEGGRGGGAQDDPLINPARRGSHSHGGSQLGSRTYATASSPGAASPRALSPGPLSALGLGVGQTGASWRSTSPPPEPAGSGPGSAEGESGRVRRESTFSMGPTRFTSRHDPAMIALAKAEIEKERPQFTNKSAGAPPQIVLMPAPLAGRAPSPPPRVRAEGPESEPESEEEEEEAEDVEVPKRPAGALYGRSLLDVMAERQAQMKGRQKQYVRAQDGRATMHDWAGTVAGQKLLGAGDAADQAEAGEEAGEMALSVHRVPRSGSKMSFFGPDLTWQKEMERKQVLDAIEAREKAEREVVVRAEEERQRIKEEKRRKWGKKRKAGASASVSEASHDHPTPSSLSHSNSVHAVPVNPADPYAAFDTTRTARHLNPPATPPRPSHTLAPSLSLPQISSPKSPGGGWGATFAKPDSPPVRKGWDVDSDEDEDDGWMKPRPQARRPETRASRHSGARTPDTQAGSVRETAVSSPAEQLAWRYGQQPPQLELGFNPSPAPSLLTGSGKSPVPRPDLSTDDELDDAGAESDSSDEVPLGLRRAPPRFADEDEAPLGLLHGGHTHRLAPANDSDEDDLPLGFKHQDAHLQQQQQQHYQAQAEQQRAYELAMAQQVQQQQAALAAHAQQQQFFAMQVAQQQMAAAYEYEGSVVGGGGGVGMGPHPGETVDRWRREVSG